LKNWTFASGRLRPAHSSFNISYLSAFSFGLFRPSDDNGAEFIADVITSRYDKSQVVFATFRLTV